MPKIINNTVLVLPSWYPNKTSPYDGDFIQRHLKAIALYCKQYVIYLVKDEKGEITKDTKTEIYMDNNITEVIIYYKPLHTGISVIDKFLAHFKYIRLYKKAIINFIKEKGLPKLVHVHVAFKAGILALWTKKRWETPYIISEHSTIYLEESDNRLIDTSIFFRKTTSRVLKNASRLTVVSNYLGKAIQKHYPFVNYITIPNVVDTAIFLPAENRINNNFIHVSNFTYQKNMEAIIEAAQILKTEGVQFVINLYGPLKADVIKKVKIAKVDDVVLFKGEVPQVELAKAMQQSTALILYSRYETFGCVIIEANACGIPVIVSDIEVFKELVTHNVNGKFVKQNYVNQLCETLKEFINNKQLFYAQRITSVTKKYSYELIGQDFNNLYNTIN